MSDVDLGDYVTSNVEDVLARVPSVGEVERFAKEYAMRVWLDIDRLNDFNLTVTDVVAALEAITWKCRPDNSSRASRGRPAPQCFHHYPELVADTRGIRRYPNPY